MKVRPTTCYRCECHYVLQSDENENIYCPNPKCKHFNKKHEAPLVELKPVA